MLPPTIFFFVVFHTVVYVRSLLGEGANVSMATSAAATVGALVVRPEGRDWLAAMQANAAALERAAAASGSRP
jgi:UPF0716 family protein affecting phage T7 exclusion